MNLLYKTTSNSNIYLDINSNIFCYVIHDAGFFSICTICLLDIIETIKFLNKNNIKYNNIFINTSQTFKLYKINNNNNFYDYFKQNSNLDNINIINEKLESIIAFIPFKTLNYNILNNYINSFFQPNDDICKIINDIESKYNLDYENICCIFYRGLDKIRETIIPSYNDFYDKIKNETKEKKHLKFLLQSDETEFLQYFKEKFTNNIIFNEEIRHLPKQNTLVEKLSSNEANNKYSQYFLAIVYIMSKCKYVYCNTSNISLWIALFRGNTNNLHQYLKQIDKFNGTLKNPLYDKNIKDVWY